MAAWLASVGAMLCGLRCLPCLVLLFSPCQCLVGGLVCVPLSLLIVDGSAGGLCLPCVVVLACCCSQVGVSVRERAVTRGWCVGDHPSFASSRFICLGEREWCPACWWLCWLCWGGLAASVRLDSVTPGVVLRCSSSLVFVSSEIFHVRNCLTPAMVRAVVSRFRMTVLSVLYALGRPRSMVFTTDNSDFLMPASCSCSRRFVMRA